MKFRMNRLWYLALACLALCPAAATFGQTVTPAAPPLPDLPLTVKAGYSAASYKPGDTGYFGLTLTNPGPATITGPGVPISTTLSVTWTDQAGGEYSEQAPTATVSVGGATVSGAKHVSPISFSWPAAITPLTSPIGFAYTFAQATDGSWLVTLPAMDVAGGGGAAGGRVMFKVGTPH